MSHVSLTQSISQRSADVVLKVLAQLSKVSLQPSDPPHARNSFSTSQESAASLPPSNPSFIRTGNNCHHRSAAASKRSNRTARGHFPKVALDDGLFPRRRRFSTHRMQRRSGWHLLFRSAPTEIESPTRKELQHRSKPVPLQSAQRHVCF